MCEGGGTGTGIVSSTYWRDWSDYECVRGMYWMGTGAVRGTYWRDWRDWSDYECVRGMYWMGTGAVRGTYWRDWSDWSDLAAYCRAWPSNSCRCSSVLEITLVGLDAIDSTVF